MNVQLMAFWPAGTAGRSARNGPPFHRADRRAVVETLHAVEDLNRWAGRPRSRERSPSRRGWDCAERPGALVPVAARRQVRAGTVPVRVGAGRPWIGTGRRGVAVANILMTFLMVSGRSPRRIPIYNRSWSRSPEWSRSCSTVAAVGAQGSLTCPANQRMTSYSMRNRERGVTERVFLQGRDVRARPRSSAAQGVAPFRGL